MSYQLIAVDCGRESVKAVSGQRRIKIRAVVGEWRERKISEGGEWEVCIDGQRAFVGELALTESRFKREMVSRSKIHDETKLLTLTAIALLSEPGASIRLVTGLPVEQHTKDTKQALTAILAGNHSVEITGQPKRYIILSDNDIAVTIEGAGAYWSGEQVKGRCRVIDLGSRTINALTINGNRFEDLNSTTLDYGCLEVQNAGGSTESAKALARRIYADLSRRWLDMASEPVLLAGGGALLMESSLREYFRQSRLADEPVWANALGYYRMGLTKWRG